MTSLPRGYYRAAQGVLFDGLILKAGLLRRQTRSQAGGPGADDKNVQDSAAFHTCLDDCLQGLLALTERVLDEPHAAQFAGDVDSRHIRFEIRFEQRDIDAAPLGSQHQRDGVERTDCLAGSVTDAIGGPHQHRFAADQTQYLVMRLLGAGFDARTAG
jgi:hypothetical protein